MRKWYSTLLHCLLLAVGVLLAGCGNDFGGLLGVDAGAAKPTDGGRDASAANEDGRVDVAAPAEDSGGMDVSASDRSVTDQGAPVDTGVNVDVPGPSDASPGADGADGGVADSGTTADVTTPDATAADARDVRSDLADGGASVDVRSDAANPDVSSGDARDGGPTGDPVCGDGVKQGTEQCDDGNTLDFDNCSSLCTDRRPCTCCQYATHLDPDYGLGMLPCDKMEGDAEGGPKFGTPKKQLCQEAYTCILRSRCGPYRVTLVGGTPQANSDTMECYCGDDNYPGGTACTSTPRGPCMAEFEAGFEIEETTPSAKAAKISSLLNQVTYGAGMATAIALNDSLGGSCSKECVEGLGPPTGSWCPADPGDAGDAGDASTSDVSDASTSDASEAAAW